LRMRALIIPTMTEADLVLSQAADKRTTYIQTKPVIQCSLKNSSWAIAVCGPGKANAAHTTGLLIDKYRPELLFMIGVAGAYPSSGLDIGDVAVGSREIYADEGLMLNSGIRTMDELNLPLAEIHNKNFFNEFPLHIPDELKEHPHIGAFATVSSCTGIDETALNIEKRLSVICENMEGAAAAHICAMSDMKMIELRGISNIIKNRDSEPLSKADILRGSESVQKFFLDRLV